MNDGISTEKIECKYCKLLESKGYLWKDYSNNTVAYILTTIKIHELATVESIEFSFDFNIIYINHIGIDKFDDVSYEWTFDQQAFNAMQNKTYDFYDDSWKDKARIYSPQNFGLDKMFYLMIDCIDDKLELSLCTYLVNMEGILRIDEVKVMLVLNWMQVRILIGAEERNGGSIRNK